MIPQARSLVTSGPYRLVRHPLYAGELVAALGLVLSGFTAVALAAWMVLCGLQAYRAVREEELLVESMPEYAGYRLGTARLVPGVF